MKKLFFFLCIMLVSMQAYSQGTETFDGLTITGNSYVDGSFEGQDGSTWEFIQSRGDFEITGKSLMLGRNRTPDAQLESGTLTGGIGTLSFDYMQSFSNNVNMQVFVNDVLVYTATSNSQQNVVLNSGDIEVNVEGDAVIKFFNASGAGQVNIDNVTWTAHSSSSIEYCIPSASNATRYISNFSTTGGTENISNLVSGFSAGGYGDFSLTHGASQIQGEVVNFASTVEGGTAGFRIWVDWNQDGIFDVNTEVAYNSSSYSGSPSGSFTVPTNATLGETRMRIVSHWLSSAGIVDPCVTNFEYGEFEDYKFTVVGMDDCSGTPEAGTVTVNPAIGNPTANYTVSSTGYTQAVSALTFQWQSNTDGAGWVDEGTTNGYYSDYIATAPAEVGVQVDWRLVVTCTASSETTYSNVAQFVTDIVYCIPSATVDTRFINNFSTTGGIDNIENLESGFSTGGFGDFTETHSVSQVAGEVINFSGTVNGGDAGFRIWVDWNQNGMFDSVTETVFFTTSYTSSPSGSFTVPAGTLVGEYRMRVVSHWLSTTASVDPCFTGFTYGEFEDYTINVMEGDACEGTPEAGTLTIDPIEGDPSSTYTVSATGYSDADGLTFQWQSNTAGAGWVNEGTATSTYADFVATAPAGEGVQVEWRLEVTCTHSSETAYSDIVAFTTTGGLDYCTPSATNADRFINNFSTTDGIENIENLESGFSDGGYGDFHLTHFASQIQGDVVNFNATVSGGSAGFRIWVDWNQDGVFDVDNEVAYHSVSYSTTPSGSFTVPAGALPGPTRMRIASHWLSTMGLVDPCATNFTYGEFEDYTFTVIAMEGCSGTPEAGEVTVNPTTGNMGSTYTVSATGFTVANGLSFQWQSNTAGAGWVDEGTASSVYADYVATAPSELGVQVEWRLAVTCVSSNETTYSTTATFETVIVYCTPDYTAGVEPITRVVFAGIDNSSSAGSNDEYEDFTAISGSVNQGESYDIALEGTSEGAFTNHFTVWIDWNQNGTFEENEKTEIGSIFNSDGTDGQQATNTIEVPADALIGETRMRVVKDFGGTYPNDPCGTYDYGQTEDYTINVSELGVGDVNNAKFAYYPNPVKDVLNFTSQKDVKSVSIFNLSGQNVMNTKIANSQINVSTLTPGVYVFKVTFEDGKVESFKIIKK